ncbi:hypothetical protein VN97_g12493 [Penicillium thymicola]|uniref:Integral membrane protein n=1 Tax=Penicillium thymicola TaxID=293382 RepID=A0AAI9X2E6_PENTH|nr:hypothetical protein VN97_g12493 [Penicillium thymicola]
MLHRRTKASHPLLQRLARVHHSHHLYFTRHLKFDRKYLRENRFQALPLELAIQISGSVLGYIIASLVTPDGLVWTSRNHLWSTVAFEILRSCFVILIEGRDSNHVTYKTVPKDPNWIFAGPEFHSLHHVHPDRYIGSLVKVLDWICGTAYSFKHKRFVITGGGGAFGRAITRQIEREEGVRRVHKLKFGIDWDHHHFENALSVLSDCDVLILAHGSKGQDAVAANCDSVIRLIELFKKFRITNAACLTLPEVWYIGSEAELHPSWGIASLQRYSLSKRKFLPHARSYFDDPDMIYRHIVPSSFHSSMGPAVPSADWAARGAMWWIRRGARYIPVTYTGIAYLNYLNFMYRIPYAEDVNQR